MQRLPTEREGSSAATLLDVVGVNMRFGGVEALRDLSFTVEEGQICGLIGPNGAGKTTMFNVVSRLYDPQAGSICLAGEELLNHPAHGISFLGISRTFQNLALWPGMSVLDNLKVGAHTRSRTNAFSAALRIGVRAEERALTDLALEILAELSLDHLAHHPADGLPFGTLKRIELARALMSRPRLLLLDEPATGLTHSEVDGLAQLIVDLKQRHDLTVLLVEHHMGMVMGISDKVVVLNFGSKIAEGPPSQVQRDPVVIDAYLGGG